MSLFLLLASLLVVAGIGLLVASRYPSRDARRAVQLAENLAAEAALAAERGREVQMLLTEVRTEAKSFVRAVEAERHKLELASEEALERRKMLESMLAQAERLLSQYYDLRAADAATRAARPNSTSYSDSASHSIDAASELLAAGTPVADVAQKSGVSRDQVELLDHVRRKQRG